MSNELTVTTPEQTAVTAPEQTTEVAATDAKNVINYNPVFPTMFASITLDLPVEDMAQDLLLLASDTENYEGGYTSLYNRQSISHIRGHKELEEAIYGITNSYLREMKYEVNPQKCNIMMWANVMRLGGHQRSATRPHSQIAGEFFIKCDEKSVPIIFENPTNPLRMHDPMVMRPEDFTPFTAPTMTIQPKPNMLMLWPSWVSHFVPKITGESSVPRVSIAFTVDFLPPGV